MHFVLSVFALLFAYVRDSQPTPEAAREISKHVRVQPAIDLRSTVLLVVFAASLPAFFKDGMGLISSTYIIWMAWVTFGGIIACVISGWASWTLFCYQNNDQEEAATLRRTSLRKVISFYAASVLLVADFFIVALGITDRLT